MKAAALGVVGLLLLAEGRAGVQAQAGAGSVATVLEQTGVSYRRASDAVWVVSCKSSSSTVIDVIVNAQNELVVVFAVVARRPALSADQLRNLMRANYEANFAKLAIDHDGDLLALAEIAPKSLTAALLRTAIEEVANTGDAGANMVRAPAPGAEHAEEVSAGRGATIALVRGAFELAYDPAKWTPQPAAPDAAVVQLTHSSGDAFLRVTTQRVEVESGHLADMALVHVKRSSPDARITSESWRTVNGLRTLLLRVDGLVNGSRFSFYNQLYSDGAGTVQIAAWTGTNLFDEYRKDFLELFAGFRKVAGR
jgi:hypothetical protein